MAKMTFREYVNSTKRYFKPSVQQNFITDARIDENFPDIESWDELDEYLKSHNAGADAFSGARIVWHNYDRLTNSIPREVWDYFEFVWNSQGFSK